jgi:pyridinium-3,5-bisthiocarboxylic acid mononucleotide nickel chelatase
MVIAYFDCYSGVAGDMVLGALVDVGMPLKHLKEQLSKVNIGSYKITKAKGRRMIKGTNLHVEVLAGPKNDTYSALDKRIASSKLSKGVRELARTTFEKLAHAEARVHGVPLSKVHFHEVGAVDSIVDVVGAAIGVEYFKFDSIHSSPIPVTRGRVKTAHGLLPVPAPATLEILKGVPLESAPVNEEIVTPTGAAIVTTLAESFGESPLQIVRKTGYGYGDKVIPGIPNALRIMIGDGFPVVAIQTNIDDMNPQIFDYVIDKLFKAGAVDVDLVPCQMKKNRPAVKLSILSPWNHKDNIIDLLLKETTTFGVRYWPVDRKVLTRKVVQKKTKYGGIAFKVGYDHDGKQIKMVPEYEDLKRVARKRNVPLLELYRDVLVIKK